MCGAVGSSLIALPRNKLLAGSIPMPDFFAVTDAYLGVRIRMEESTWFRHVLPHHPDMAAHLEDAKRALTDPCAVLASKRHSDRLIYHFALSGRKGLYVRVVVHIYRNEKDEAVRGVARTAFLTDTIGGGEVRWLSRQSE
jgi:hypothetical protein